MDLLLIITDIDPKLFRNRFLKGRTQTHVADPDPYLDPIGSDSIGSVDPDPDSESGSGHRRAKMTHKSRKICKSSCFEVLDGFF